MAETTALGVIALLVVLLVIVLGSRRPTPSHEVLEQIFGESSLPTPGPAARAWALGVLYEAGVDADADPVYAMKELRSAEPRLTLGAARVLVDTLNAA